MNKIVGRILLLAGALGIAAIFGYFFFSKDMSMPEIIILGTTFMVLGEITYHLDKKWFQNK